MYSWLPVNLIWKNIKLDMFRQVCTNVLISIEYLTDWATLWKLTKLTKWLPSSFSYVTFPTLYSGLHDYDIRDQQLP